MLPFDFSPITILSFGLVLALYGVALIRMPESERPGSGRIVTFVLGVLLCYGVMQTRFDYYSQYMFFVHRAQHLVLHHLGPILIALSNPLPILRFWSRRIPGPALPWLRPLGVAY
ncbi:MAG: cytochrome c oxidase assembly protein, partial [Pseudomonadota bacterium]|nr:cytochrome c oxidase assembly protein [Pseudomonadota bacterium]